MTRCTYPTCTTNGRCPVIALPLGKRCPAKPRPADEQRELDARLPLGDDVWRDGVMANNDAHDRQGTTGNISCRCGSGLPGYWEGDYCVACSPFDLFCDDCPDRVRCESKCRRDGVTTSPASKP